MGADISSLDWRIPFRVDEKLSPDQVHEFVQNIEAADDLINNPEFLMEHIQRLFPEGDDVPIDMVKTISQSFIDGLRVSDRPVLNKVALFFYDISSNYGTVVPKAVLRGYLASVLSILYQAAHEEAHRLHLKVRTREEKTNLGAQNPDIDGDIPSPPQQEEGGGRPEILKKKSEPIRFTIASSSSGSASYVSSDVMDSHIHASGFHAAQASASTIAKVIEEEISESDADEHGNDDS